MTTRDMFLDALTVTAPAPSAARAIRMKEQRRTVQSINQQAAAIHTAPPAPTKPVQARRALVAGDGTLITVARPDFADEIDRMVLQLIDDGEIALDVETDTYRTTRYKYLRFSE